MNNGVQGYVDFLGFLPNPQNTFSVIQIGEHISQFRNRKWYASQNIFLLKPKLLQTITNHHFITTAINKSLEIFSDSYSNYPTLKTLTNLIIRLPQTTDGNIDFVFMENFIRELEEERIRELAAYLKVSGYSSYELFPAEQKALKMFEKWEWKEYRIGDLFNVKTGSLVSNEYLYKGNIPRISVKVTENGIIGNFDTNKNSQARHYENFISVNFFGKAFYHPYRASVEMKVHVLKIKAYDYTKKTGLFITSLLNKSLANNFSYGDQLSSSDLKNNDLFISLPVAPDGSPDYEAMETLISAVQKLVIKDVVLYADRKIAAAKKAKGRNIRRDKITED